LQILNKNFMMRCARAGEIDVVVRTRDVDIQQSCDRLL